MFDNAVLVPTILSDLTVILSMKRRTHSPKRSLWTLRDHYGNTQDSEECRRSETLTKTRARPDMSHRNHGQLGITVNTCNMATGHLPKRIGIVLLIYITIQVQSYTY